VLDGSYYPKGSELRSNLGGIDRIPSWLPAVVEAQGIVNVGGETHALAFDNKQFAITPIPNIVEHLHRRGGRLCGRDRDKNHKASSDEHWGPDIEHRSH
jgi:hypothetical protein